MRCSLVYYIFSTGSLLSVQLDHIVLPVSSQTSSLVRKCCIKFPNCEAIPEEVGDVRGSPDNPRESSPLMTSPPIPIDVPPPPLPEKCSYWVRLFCLEWSAKVPFICILIYLQFSAMTLSITKPDLKMGMSENVE